MDENQKPPEPTASPIPNSGTVLGGPPLRPAPPPLAPKPARTNATEIVWQWLCYGLWVWTICVLSILLSSVLTYYFVHQSNDYEFTVYVLAALLCLLPLAVVADRLYSKREPDQKHGFAAVVMVLHAVGTFVVALGSLITLVVTVLTFVISSGNTTTKHVVLISSSVVCGLAFLLFIRILRPAKLVRFLGYFAYIIVGITAVTLVATALGPFKSAIANKDDRLIESNLSTVNQAVQDYARSNNKLPAKLEDIKLNNAYKADAKLLVSRNLVRYRVISDLSTANTSVLDLSKTKTSTLNNTYRSVSKGSYELCVTYKSAKGDEESEYPSRYSSELEGATNTSYLSTYTHKAGEQCYKQTVSGNY